MSDQVPDQGQTEQTQQTQDQSTGPEAAKGFTQAEVDRIVKERLERAKSKYADYEDLKARATKLDELEKAQMDEKDRLAAEIEAQRQRADAAEQARIAALKTADDRLIRAEITAIAATMGFHYPADMYRVADLSAVTIDEDTGNVLGAKEALEALAKERPDYVAKTAAPRIDGEARTKEGDNLPKLSPAQERVAANMGIDPLVYAKRLAAKSSNGVR